MKKLTIGIPTFNSREYLKGAIEKILDQISPLSDVELLICDNSSTDGTGTLVAEYINKFPDIIRYIRHESNIGMDRNFWSVIQNARGAFVHLHADDDFYINGGIERVLDKITTHTLDAVVLSNNYLNTFNGKIIRNHELCSGDILCERGGEEFFLNENLKTLCLSNIVVKRCKCLAITDIERYFGCQWLHVALLTEIVRPDSTVYIFNFSDPVITVRIGNQRWLEQEGAVTFYYNALLVLRGLQAAGYESTVFEHIKTRFLPLILNGDRINFNSMRLNIVYCLKFFKIYYNMPKQYLKFCLKLVFKKHRRFFEGWENIGD